MRFNFSLDCPFNARCHPGAGRPVSSACDSLRPHTVSQGEFCAYWPRTGCTSEQQDHQAAAAAAAARISLLNYSKPSSPLKRVKGPLLGWKNTEYSRSRQQKVQLQMGGALCFFFPSPPLPPSFAMQVIHFNIRLLSRLCGGNVPGASCLVDTEPKQSTPQGSPSFFLFSCSLSQQDADVSNLCTIIATFLLSRDATPSQRFFNDCSPRKSTFLERAGSVSFLLFFFFSPPLIALERNCG